MLEGIGLISKYKKNKIKWIGVENKKRIKKKEDNENNEIVIEMQ